MSRTISRVTTAQVRREMMRMDRKAGRKRARIGTLLVLAAALLAGTLVARFLFALADIRTTGMDGALQSGDVVLCERMTSPLRTGKLGRGALALVQYSDNGLHRQTVRRVVAMAGDVVSVEPDGQVTVNGEPVDEPYARYRAQNTWSSAEVTPGGALENPFASPGTAVVQPAQSETASIKVDDVEYPLTVPEGQLFVLCDNRENAMDSRSTGFGLVKEANVLGLARAVIWPAHRMAFLADDGIE